jgi:hypothetical protein
LESPTRRKGGVFMINLATNINAVKPIADLRKWEVSHVSDFDNIDLPQFAIALRLYGQNSNPWPGNPYTLYIRDTGQSYVLTANATPLSLVDQFLLANTTLDGTPYTTLATAYYAATGKNNQKKAIENLLITIGAVPASFAGT